LLGLGVKAASSHPDECIALAMSGGGTFGAFEAGALWGLYHSDTDKSKYEYDVVTGVSAGAINTGAVSVYEIGDEENMVNDLSMKWQQLTEDQLLTRWKPAGMITGVLKKSGVFDTSPLHKFLDEFFAEHNNTIHRKFVVSSVDANTGSYHLFNETTEDPMKAILSSASIPFVFPDQDWSQFGMVGIDGGTVWNTNLVSAVQRCREKVDDDSKITVDILVCFGYDIDKDFKTSGNTIDNYMRFIQIRDYYNGMDDVLNFMRAYPEVNFRYYV
jgi:predicted acylesterase/phospholipase RssA